MFSLSGDSVNADFASRRATIRVDRGNSKLNREAKSCRQYRPAVLAEALCVMIGAAIFSPAPAQTQRPPEGGLVNPVPQGSPIPRILPAPPPTTVPAPSPGPTPPSGEELTGPPVFVSRVSFEGITVYPEADFEREARDLVGPAVPEARIDAIRQAIVQRYKGDGYTLATISVKVGANGQLRFIVTEGRIARVRLDGDIGPAGTQVLRFLQRVTKPQAIDQATLERALLLANEVPGVTVRGILQPSTEEPGALTLVAQVERRPVTGLLTFDNRAFRDIGPVEALTVLDLNSFTALGERTELSLYHAFPNSETFGQASTEFFVGDSGLRLRIFAGAGPTSPSSGVLQKLGYWGYSTVFGVTASYPLIRTRQQALDLTASADASDSTVDTATGPNGASVMQSFDAVRALRLGSQYAWSDLWGGVERSASNGTMVRLAHGLPALGASTNGQSPTASRFGEQANFTKIVFEATRTQVLVQFPGAASIALMGLLTGQWSNNALPPVEQFYLGGSRLTRGYYSGQVTGDKAVATTAELQLNTSFSKTAFGMPINANVQYYTFYDWGEVWQNSASLPQARLASAGAGARMKITEYTEFDFEGLTRLNRHLNGQMVNPSGVYWRVLTRF
jgi:hemolysin activation/secretion protein